MRSFIWLVVRLQLTSLTKSIAVRLFDITHFWNEVARLPPTPLTDERRGWNVGHEGGESAPNCVGYCSAGYLSIIYQSMQPEIKRLFSRFSLTQKSRTSLLTPLYMKWNNVPYPDTPTLPHTFATMSLHVTTFDPLTRKQLSYLLRVVRLFESKGHVAITIACVFLPEFNKEDTLMEQSGLWLPAFPCTDCILFEVSHCPLGTERETANFIGAMCIHMT